jgi:hypothetical protein
MLLIPRTSVGEPNGASIVVKLYCDVFGGTPLDPTVDVRARLGGAATLAQADINGKDPTSTEIREINATAERLRTTNSGIG